MKRLTIHLLFLVLISSCSFDKERKIDSPEDWTVELNEEYKYGYLNVNGEEELDYKYADAKEFVGEYAIVSLEENEELQDYVIDSKGTICSKGYYRIMRATSNSMHLFIGLSISKTENDTLQSNPNQYRYHLINVTNKIENEDSYDFLSYANYGFTPYHFEATVTCDTCGDVRTMKCLVNEKGTRITKYYNDIVKHKQYFIVAHDFKDRAIFYNYQREKISIPYKLVWEKSKDQFYFEKENGEKGFLRYEDQLINEIVSLDCWTIIYEDDKDQFYFEKKKGYNGYLKEVDSVMQEVLSLRCTSIMYDDNIPGYKVMYLEEPKGVRNHYEIWSDDFKLKKRSFCYWCKSIDYDEKRKSFVSYFFDESRFEIAFWDKDFNRIKVIPKDIDYSLVPESDLISISTSNRKYAYFKIEEGVLKQVTRVYDYSLYQWNERSLGDAIFYMMSIGDFDHRSKSRSEYRIPEFEDGYSKILYKKKYGIINNKGEEVLEPNYNEVSYLGNKKFKTILKGDTSMVSLDEEY